jgi:hypothetical protein
MMLDASIYRIAIDRSHNESDKRRKCSISGHLLQWRDLSEVVVEADAFSGDQRRNQSIGQGAESASRQNNI